MLVERIKSLMQHVKLKQDAFGKSIGITQGKMSKILRGEQSVPDNALAEIFRVYKVHPNWLFGFEGESSDVRFLTDWVPKEKFEKAEKEIYDLRIEIGDVYKQWAEDRKEYQKKPRTSKIVPVDNKDKKIRDQEINIDNLKNN